MNAPSPSYDTSSAGTVPLASLSTYTVTASFRAASAPRNVKVGTSWYTAAGANAGVVYGTVVTDTTSGWTTVTHTGVAPANAVFVSVAMVVVGAAANETHYVDKIGVWLGTDVVWEMPALPVYYEDIGRGPALATATGEWIPVEADGQWHRIVLKTRARVEENEGQVSFVGARWIDALIEVRNANDLKVSATMIDPTEYPLCAYFDGAMTENLSLDDFLWEKDPDASVSYYYFDRVIRAKFLWSSMAYVAPANRPYQIFFGSYWRPYVGATGDTVLLQSPAGGTLSGMSVRSTSQPQPPPPF